MTTAARIESHRGDLTAAERRVASVVLDDPESVAFGTVAVLAQRARVSTATVVRLAIRLGYPGFPGLRSAVQEELTDRLRPAATRIRQPKGGDVLARTAHTELANVARTLDRIDPDTFAEVAALLAGSRTRGGRVVILSGDASYGIATLMASELALLRPGVELVTGSAVGAARVLAHLGRADVLVVLDLSRYDRWVVQAARRARADGGRLVVITDSPLAEVTTSAHLAFTVSDVGIGPFDSHVGMLVLVNALIAAVSQRLRRAATARLDRVEAAWHDADALSED